LKEYYDSKGKYPPIESERSFYSELYACLISNEYCIEQIEADSLKEFEVKAIEELNSQNFSY
jgi:hypothetical protein